MRCAAESGLDASYPNDLAGGPAGTCLAELRSSPHNVPGPLTHSDGHTVRRNLVVMGASAGGIDALRAIAAGLPQDFAAAICVVTHMSADSPGIMDVILSRAGNLPAVCVRASEPLRPGTIYVPRPDHHLIVEPGRVIVTRGPKENRFRPAIDPLFRSAAQAYGPRLVGVILTGGLDDGTAGLWTVKQLGGIAVVQDPKDALVESMPQNACTHVRVDHCLPLSRIPALLVRLTTEDILEAGGYTVPEPVEIEIKIAREDAPLQVGVETLGEPSTYACPECHGVLLELEEGGRMRYRCHTGHAYSMESLIADMDEAIEESLWGSIRALQEKALLARHLEKHARDSHNLESAEMLNRLARHAEERAGLVRSAVLEPEVTQADAIAPSDVASNT
jgi:two-component system chemotaxis response regulator CheB